MTLLEQFHGDIRQHVLQSLPYDPRYADELKLKSASQLLIIYWNWTARLVPSEPRVILRSASLSRWALNTCWEHRWALEVIASKLHVGQDITPHRSRGIRHGYVPHRANSKHRRPDLDLLLNDWGVHHLHLSTSIALSTFDLFVSVKRISDANHGRDCYRWELPGNPE